MKFPRFVKTPDFAYFIGFFVADGSFYADSNSSRFEFVDGTSVQEELELSREFMSLTKKYVEEILGKKLPNLRKRGNKYVLQFRNKYLDELFKKIGFSTGNKSKTCDVPRIFSKSDLERFFWIGVMDGDGMVARSSRKISLESVSFKLISSFSDFLNRNSVKYTFRIRNHSNNRKSYRVDIQEFMFNKFLDLLPFRHPRKKLWAKKHKKRENFYVLSKLKIKQFLLYGDVINYFEIFKDKLIFVVDGKNLTTLKSKFRNIGLAELKHRLNKPDEEILKKLSSLYFKASKGSTIKVKLPFNLNEDLIETSKFIHIRTGGIAISRTFVSISGKDPKIIINKISKLFEINPQTTCRNEIIFSSMVLKCFFEKILVREKY
ncbi:hypothetical protein K9L97_05275 [Candidatus Woesearchaeota archaeon]|nr:hypothetical protein [Candidatus Woesearchaeota archaeon]